MMVLPSLKWLFLKLMMGTMCLLSEEAQSMVLKNGRVAVEMWKALVRHRSASSLVCSCCLVGCSPHCWNRLWIVDGLNVALWLIG